MAMTIGGNDVGGGGGHHVCGGVGGIVTMTIETENLPWVDEFDWNLDKYMVIKKKWIFCVGDRASWNNGDGGWWWWWGWGCAELPAGGWWKWQKIGQWFES